MTKIFFVIVLCCFSLSLFAQQGSPEIRYEDKIRFKEALRFFNQTGHTLWSGWVDAPFGIVLVTNDNEYLINHSAPSEDFKSIGFDTILNTEIFIRARKFPANFLATFNAVNNIPTIVVGQPENAGRSSLGWVKVLLHEHFHQLQYSKADYVEKTKGLDLAGDDSTGMWMLNYPFPYEDDKVANQYAVLTLAAKNTAFASHGDFENKYKDFMEEKQKFKSMLSEKDYRYFSFQIWQEGIAQYTENQMIQMMIDNNYSLSDEFKLLKDYKPIDSFYVRMNDNLKENAEKLDLRTSKRACFYSYGAFEGMILDRVNPNWKNLYFTGNPSTERYFVKP
jgi:hypothetical protein